jgi:Domain of unknown function (DUF1735)/Domain of unknown function (DUF4361)
MNRKLINSIGLVAVLSVLLTACIKDDVTDTTTQGSTFIKILEAPSNALYYLPFTDVKTIDLFSLRKDANSETELNTATTVKMTIVPSILDDYNDANGETFELLPDSIYTTTITKAGNVYDMSLASGEFAKEFTIKLNGAKWDIAHKYAMPLVISDAGGKKMSTGRDTILAFISVKNKYDGIYHAAGVFHHPTAGDRAIDRDKNLVTAGPISVVTELGDLGGSGYKMILTINPDNTVTITKAGVTPNVDQHWGPNFYDPATKEFHLNYSYNTAAPRIVDEVLKLK